MVGLKVGPIYYNIGTASFLHCFFSSIAYNLESGKWGSEFPLLMHELYSNELAVENIPDAMTEITRIREMFKNYSPDCVIWDIENTNQLPPWGKDIAHHITSLSNYFYTSDGNDLFDVFIKALDTAQRVNKNIIIKVL